MADKYLRRWHFEHYFQGNQHLDVSEETSEEEIREQLDGRYFRDNWKSDSLRRGEKIRIKSRSKRKKKAL